MTCRRRSFLALSLLSALTVFAIGSLHGCSSGQQDKNRRLSPTAVASFRNGITTKGQVRELLGPPQDVVRQLPLQQTSGTEPLPVKMTATEIWGYWTDAGGESAVFSTPAPGRPHYLVTIFFDARGVVLHCQTELAGS